MKITSFEEFKELARRGTFVPVVKEMVADLLTPVSAFLKIAEDADYAFLLESVEGGEHVARYSFLGKDPFLILRAHGARTTIDRGGITSESDRPLVETLRKLMADFRSPFVPELPRFTDDVSGHHGRAEVRSRVEYIRVALLMLERDDGHLRPAALREIDAAVAHRAEAVAAALRRVGPVEVVPAHDRVPAGEAGRDRC